MPSYISPLVPRKGMLLAPRAIYASMSLLPALATICGGLNSELLLSIFTLSSDAPRIFQNQK